MEPLFLPKSITTFREGYSRKAFLRDLMAGIIVVVVALPLAIAFAIASGVSPEKGLITAVIAGFTVSILGGSRVQIGGPTGSIVVVVAGIVAAYGIEGLVISTIMAGVIMVLFGLFRMGAIIKFIPYPVTVGFTSGIAVVIFMSQIRDFFGLQMDAFPADFVGRVSALSASFSTLNPLAVVIASLSILITLLWSKVSKKIPGSLIALLLGVGLVTFFGLEVETIGTRFGEISASFPKPSIPNVSLGSLVKYIGPAFTIAILSSIESLLSAVVSDSMLGSRHRSNTELIAQGIANMGSGLFGGIPATGALARTATNVKNGGRTPVAGMIHAVILLMIMLFAGKWATLIPLSTLAGILMVVAYNMSEWRSFKDIMKGSKYDTGVLITTFILTVVVDLTVAIQVGMILAAILFIKRMSDAAEVKPLLSYPKDGVDDMSMVDLKLPKHVDIFEISGPMFFGVANRFKELMHKIGNESTVVIIRLRNVPLIDATGIYNFHAMLTNLISLKKRVILSGVNESVKTELERHGIFTMLGQENIYATFDEALEKATAYTAEEN